MPLSQAAIEEFRVIWREEFGEDLSEADAEARARAFLKLVYTLSRRPQRASTADLWTTRP